MALRMREQRDKTWRQKNRKRKKVALPVFSLRKAADTHLHMLTRLARALAGREQRARKAGFTTSSSAEHRGVRTCIRIAAPADAERQGA